MFAATRMVAPSPVHAMSGLEGQVKETVNTMVTRDVL